MTLGVKQKLKTVVTGMRFIDGVAHDIDDPKLETASGGTVPVMARAEAYKHLGLMLRADGEWSDNWRRLRMKVGEAMAKLSRLRRVTMHEFEMIGDVLMRGLVAFYVMGSYITRDEAEELEKMYRRRFRQRFGVPPGTAVAQYYDSGVRTPAWAVAAGTFYSVMTSRATDVEDLSRRRAARSAIARAAHKWGCRESIITWRCEHILPALREHVARSRVRDLGECWWLAVLELGPAADELVAEAARKAAGEEVEVCERGGAAGSSRLIPPAISSWHEDEVRADTWTEEAGHWCGGESAPLFGRAGLGIAFERRLAWAGVVEVGNFCRWRWDEEGVQTLDFYHDFEEAARVLRMDAGDGELGAAWERVAATLFAAEVDPVEPADRAGWERWMPGARCGDEGAPADSRVLYRALQDALAGKRRRSVAEWEAMLRELYDVPHHAASTSTWSGGSAPWREGPEGPCIFAELPSAAGEVVLTRRGGEARWGAMRELDEHGFLEGWDARARDTLQRVCVTREGGLVAKATGQPLTAAMSHEEFADMGLDGAVEAVARAVGADGRAWSQRAVERSLSRLVKWEARVDAQLIASLDGSRASVPSPEGGSELRGARAVCLSDGRVWMHINTNACNYQAEFRAQMDVARSSGVQRVVIEFDASSPVLRMLRFARQGAHRRRDGFLRAWADEWWEVLQCFEAVVFLWQPSHVGHGQEEPVNEWADKFATRALTEGDEEVCATERPLTYASHEVAGVTRSIRSWAVAAAQRVAVEHVRGRVTRTQLREADDLELDLLHGGGQRWRWAVLGGRAQIGDERLFAARALVELSRGLVCPHGCTECDGQPAVFTWEHVQFRCRAPPLVGLRREWSRKAWGVKKWLDNGGVHDAWYAMLTRLDAGVMPEAMAPRVRALATGSESELAMRRAVGGLVRGVGVRLSKSRRAALTAVIDTGLRLQAEGARMTAAVVDEAKRRSAAARLMRPMWTAWKLGAWAGGPARWRAVANVRWAADAVRALQASRGQGGMDALGSLDGGLHVCALARAAEGRVARELRKLWRTAHGLPFLALGEAKAAWRLAAAMWRWRRWRAARVAASAAVADAAVHDAALLRGSSREAAAAAVLRARSIVGEDANGPMVRERVSDATVHALLSWEGGVRGVAVAAPARAAAGGGRSLAALERMAWHVLAECRGDVVAAARRADRLEGRSASCGGMWVVRDVLEVRRPAGGRGPQLEVRVLWAGQWGAQQAQWVRVTQLNGEAKRAARALEAGLPPRRTSGRADAAGGPGQTRKSPRIAGEAAVEGRENPDRRKRRAAAEQGQRKRRALERGTGERGRGSQVPAEALRRDRVETRSRASRSPRGGEDIAEGGVRRRLRSSACGLRLS